eukprot:scaffold198593_cov21-Tisochrysis_lutea.AAC.3
MEILGWVLPQANQTLLGKARTAQQLKDSVCICVGSGVAASFFNAEHFTSANSRDSVSTVMLSLEITSSMQL